MRSKNWVLLLSFMILVRCCPIRTVSKEVAYLRKFDGKIQKLVENNRIRSDQGEARCQSIRTDIIMYKAGELNCKEIKKKAKYLIGNN